MPGMKIFAAYQNPFPPKTTSVGAATLMGNILSVAGRHKAFSNTATPDDLLARLAGGGIRRLTGITLPTRMRFYTEVTKDLSPGCLEPPTGDDPKGEGFAENVFLAALRERDAAIAEKVEAAFQERMQWRQNIDQAVSVMIRSSWDVILSEDFDRLPLELIKAPLTEKHKIQLLGYTASQVEDVPDPLKGVPLLASILMAASKLPDPADLIQAGFDLIKSVVKKEWGKPANSADQEELRRILNTSRVLLKTIRMFREATATVLASQALSVLEEFSHNLNPSEAQLGVLGDVAVAAESVGNQDLAFELIEMRVNLAFVLIQDQKPSPESTVQWGALDENGNPKQSGKADATSQFSLDDFPQLTVVIRDAANGLDADRKERFFQHVRKATEALPDNLKKRVKSYLRSHWPRAH